MPLGDHSEIAKRILFLTNFQDFADLRQRINLLLTIES